MLALTLALALDLRRCLLDLELCARSDLGTVFAAGLAFPGRHGSSMSWHIGGGSATRVHAGSRVAFGGHTVMTVDRFGSVAGGTAMLLPKVVVCCTDDGVLGIFGRHGEDLLW